METNLMPLIMSVPKAIQEAPIRSWTWMIMDESGILEEIEVTHFPDGREIDVQSILSIINNILKDCVINPSLEDSKDEAEFVDEAVQHEIHKLSPKVAYLSSEVGDVHAKTIDVFNMLSNYPWEAKLTLALAALVTNYGEYWVVAQSNSQQELTKMMKFLRQMGENPAQQSRFDVLHDLIFSMLHMIQGILKIKEFMLSADETTISIATTIIVIASYWTVRSIVISVPYIHSLFAEDYEPSASKERELVIMTRKIRTLLECLQNHQESFGKVQHALHDAYDIQEKHYREMLCAFEEDHGDNMWILNLLFNSKGNNDLGPIVDCSTNKRVELESFKIKKVVLMISSGIDYIPKQMLHNLAKIWNDMLHFWEGHDEYEIIWFPIVEQSVQWGDSMQHKFEELRFKMPFHSTNDPRYIDPTVIKFVKEKFNFKKETILVVMDGIGKILHHNAIHMLWTWAVFARTFTREKSIKLLPFPLTVEWEMEWQAYYWEKRYGFITKDLFLGVDDMTRDLIYAKGPAWVIGGDDMELIKRLESNITGLDEHYKTRSRIVYIGKSSSWEITGNKEWRHSWEDDEDDNKIWLFWTRVESMLLSRIHFLRNSASLDENEDRLAKTLKKLLSYDKNGQTWVLYKDFFSREFVIEDVLTLLDAISDVTERHYSSYYDFLKALEEGCKQLRATSPSHAYGCSQLEFHTKTLPESIKCPECGRSMEKCIALLCCHHHH